jgi:hypothetical protein
MKELISVFFSGVALGGVFSGIWCFAWGYDRGVTETVRHIARGEHS